MLKSYKRALALVEKVKVRFPIVRKVESVPSVLKLYYQDALSVYKLSSLPEGKKSRRDVEMERRTSRELGYVAASGIIFWIPMVGAPFIMLQMLFPRYLLTTHFWSDKERLEILSGIYRDYQPFRDQLRQGYFKSHGNEKKRLEEEDDKKNILDYQVFVPPNGQYNFDVIGSDHLRLLTYASTTVPSFFPNLLVKMIPKFILLGWFQKYATEILRDDTLLLAEMGATEREESSYLDSLSLGELQFAVSRRGGVPSDEDEHMKDFLRLWLTSSDKVLKRVVSDGVPLQHMSSYIVHSCSLPELHTTTSFSATAPEDSTKN